MSCNEESRGFCPWCDTEFEFPVSYYFYMFLENTAVHIIWTFAIFASSAKWKAPRAFMSALRLSWNTGSFNFPVLYTVPFVSSLLRSTIANIINVLHFLRKICRVLACVNIRYIITRSRITHYLNSKVLLASSSIFLHSDKNSFALLHQADVWSRYSHLYHISRRRNRGWIVKRPIFCLFPVRFSYRI